MDYEGLFFAFHRMSHKLLTTASVTDLKEYVSETKLWTYWNLSWILYCSC